MPHYRDSETGRFVSHNTYTSSVSQSGTRYNIEYSPKEIKKLAELAEKVPESEELDFFSDNYIDDGYEAPEESEY